MNGWQTHMHTNTWPHTPTQHCSAYLQRVLGECRLKPKSGSRPLSHHQAIAQHNLIEFCFRWGPLYKRYRVRHMPHNQPRRSINHYIKQKKLNYWMSCWYYKDIRKAAFISGRRQEMQQAMSSFHLQFRPLTHGHTASVLVDMTSCRCGKHLCRGSHRFYARCNMHRALRLVCLHFTLAN